MVKKRFLVTALFFIIFILVIIQVVFVSEDIVFNKKAAITIENLNVPVEVADTHIKRTQGLSEREELSEDSGLLFVFEKSDRHGIWMRDMHFPIDIIWIGEDGRIVDIKQNVSPDTYPQIFQPQEPARYVLEVNAGFTEQHGIEIGALTGIDL